MNVSRGINDPEQTPFCLKCNKPMNRVFVAPPIVFNGQGFNVTNG